MIWIIYYINRLVVRSGLDGVCIWFWTIFLVMDNVIYYLWEVIWSELMVLENFIII